MLKINVFELRISSVMLLVITLKNRAISSLNNIVCIAMWSLVTYEIQMILNEVP